MFLFSFDCVKKFNIFIDSTNERMWLGLGMDGCMTQKGKQRTRTLRLPTTTLQQLRDLAGSILHILHCHSTLNDVEHLLCCLGILHLLLHLRHIGK